MLESRLAAPYPKFPCTPGSLKSHFLTCSPFTNRDHVLSITLEQSCLLSRQFQVTAGEETCLDRWIIATFRTLCGTPFWRPGTQPWTGQTHKSEKGKGGVVLFLDPTECPSAISHSQIILRGNSSGHFHPLAQGQSIIVAFGVPRTCLVLVQLPVQ